MKILLTGAAGSLGREVARQLQARRHTLVLVGRNLERLRSAFPQSTDRLIETDYAVAGLTAELEPFDAVVHLAGRRLSKEHNRLEDYWSNVAITENLLDVADSFGAKRFVFASTYSIYAAHLNAIPFREDQCVAPTNPYAISKLAAENLGLMRNPEFFALRFSQLVGPRERTGYLLMTFVLNAVQHKPLRVVGRGEGRRDYLYVKDAARSVTCAVECDGVGGVFNIGSGVATSHRELALQAKDVFSEGRSEITSVPTQQEDTSVAMVDNSRAASLLLWQPEFSLADAFRDMRAEDGDRLLRRSRLEESLGA